MKTILLSFFLLVSLGAFSQETFQGARNTSRGSQDTSRDSQDTSRDSQDTAQLGDFKVTLHTWTDKKMGMLVFSGEKHSFTVVVRGDSVKSGGDGQTNFVVADNAIVQVSCVPMPDGVDASGYSVEQQKTVLNLYVNYEMDYFNKELKLTTPNPQRSWVVIKDRTYLIWQFDAPRKKETDEDETEKRVKHQIYFSTVWYDQVLDLNCPVMEDGSKEKSTALLYMVAQSLKSYEGKLENSQPR
jgi:hypothetical protein